MGASLGCALERPAGAIRQVEERTQTLHALGEGWRLCSRRCTDIVTSINDPDAPSDRAHRVEQYVVFNILGLVADFLFEVSAAENPLPEFRRVLSEEKSPQGLNRLKIAWSPGSDQPGVALL